jgi:hypothetical protein
MSRPFFKSGIGDLEAAFDRERSDPEFLLKLIDEWSSCCNRWRKGV